MNGRIDIGVGIGALAPTAYRNADRLFRMVLHEEGSDDELRALVSRETLLQLILRTIDHAKEARAVANQRASKQVAGYAKERARETLYQWLDVNISEYSGHLDKCAEAAQSQIKELGRGQDWVRKQITCYRKERRLARC